MNIVIGAVSVALGLAYIALGVLGVFEVMQDYRVLGVSRFGLGFAIMASSCGPHHMIHALHAFEGKDVSGTVAVATLMGLPAGLGFVTLRLEAMFGGRGDRFISGTPRWLAAIPVSFLIVVGLLVDHAAFSSSRPLDVWSPAFLPNLFVVVTYSLVGWCLIRTQIRRRPELGGWSLSGVALAAIFPTCAAMHLTYAFAARGDLHSAVFDIWGIPASLYFLWVVRRLYQQSIVDWNRRPIIGDSRPAARRSPWEHNEPAVSSR